VPNDISGFGGLAIDCPISAGTIVLGGRNSFAGGVTITSGALRLTNSTALGTGPKTITLTAGTAGNPQLRLDGSAGAITLPASISFATSNSSGAIFNEAGSNTLQGNFTLGSGGGNTKIVVDAGTLTLNGNLAPNTTSRNLDLSGGGNGTINGAITDGAAPNVLGVIKTGTGTWTLNGDNRWTGSTSVNAGTLLIHGRLAGGGAINVASGATLGGTGAIAGNVTVASGGRLAPGASIGTLTLSGTLTLAAGSTTSVELNAQTFAHDSVLGLSRVTYGGTLAVTNLAGTFAAGQSFALFDAALAGGSFSAITPALGGGLTWEFNPLTGILRVLGSSSTLPDSRIANLSILTSVSPLDPRVIVGTVIGGAGTSGGKPLLVRAVGPSLAPFGVTGMLPDPKLDLYSGPTVVTANDNWEGTAALRAAFTQAGAFAYLSADARDAAVLRDALPPGGYTVHVTGADGTGGAVLVELYDGTPAEVATPTTPRLLNVSVLKSIAPGGLLTAGFVLSGTTGKQVLIRAVGPTLAAAPFNLSGLMSDPKVDLYRGSTVIASNDNWGGGADLTAVFTRTGAFALPAASKDAVLLVTLGPGAYTAQVSGVGGTAGLVIVEVYEVP
jgi:autotransporter-associated beta strand protein